MSNIGYEYAEALFLLSCEEQSAEKYLFDLRLVKSILDESPEYLELLHSPSIPLQDKLNAIENAFIGRINEYVVSFLKLLCENNRIEYIYSCFENYEKLYNQVKRVIISNVTSAVLLTDDEKARIISKLEKKFGYRVELICKIDEKILGGIIIETDDVILDGSLICKMRDVKEVIKSDSKT